MLKAALDTLQVLGRSTDRPCPTVLFGNLKCMILFVNPLNEQKVGQLAPGDFQKVRQLISVLYVAKPIHNASLG